MPLATNDVEAVVADVVAQANDTIVDGIAWCCELHPEGNPAVDKASQYAEAYRIISEEVRSKSAVKIGVLMQSTMGHGGFPGESTAWQLAVKTNGTSVYRMCPLDRRFLDYIARQCRTLSALKPDFFMVDDDTRIIWNLVPGCFCPLHLAELEKATGRTWTREEAAARAASGDRAFLDVWERIKFDSLAALFRTIRENFSADIPGILCANDSVWHFKNAKAYAEMLAAPGQTPVVRGGGAPYGSNELFGCLWMRSHYAWQLEQLGAGVVLMQEADSCPQTLWACSARRYCNYMVLAALEGVKGAKMWITRLSMTRERKSQEAFRKELAAWRGLVEWAAKTDFKPAGIVVPNVGCYNDLEGWPGFGERYLGIVGLPYRFGKASCGEVTALCADSLRHMDRQAIREALSGRVLLDASAANWLSEQGFSDLIGVRAKPWARRTIQSHRDENGRELGPVRVDGQFADLTELAPEAKVLSRLYNIPAKGAKPEYEAPGSYEYANSCGGRVVSFALPLRDAMPAFYDCAMFSETYKDWIVRLVERLGGRLPAYFTGVGAVMCEAGETTADGEVVVLEALNLDEIAEPTVAFADPPKTIERLGLDGVWRTVEFEKDDERTCRIRSRVRVQEPAVFRIKR